MRREKRNDNLTPFSQAMRKFMTKEERHLRYDFLKGLNVSVKRQYVIGTYIADFYIASKSLVIELDGGGHYEPEQEEYDRRRDAFMNEQGIKVLRYSNPEVNTNFSGVCEGILRELELMEE